MADSASGDGRFEGGGAPTAPEVTVNPENLSASAEDIDADLRDNVTPIVEKFRQMFQGGGQGGFGAGPAFITDESYEFAARINKDHYDYAKMMSDRLQKVREGLTVLSEAARLMAADFTTVDEQNTIGIVEANGYLGRAQRNVDAAKESEA